MSVCISCCYEFAPPNKLCDACRERMMNNVLAKISAADQSKPIDELAPRTVEFKVNGIHLSR